MVAFAPFAEPSALPLAVWPEQSRRLPASPGVRRLRYIDAPVCRDEDKNSDGDCTDAATGIQGSNSGDEHLYYCQDGNYHTTSLVDSYDGAVVERYRYDPYGKVTVLHGVRDNDGTSTTEWDERASADAFHNEILYCGYRFDTETGLYHVRHRMYHPTLGRWLQRDSLWAPGSARARCAGDDVTEEWPPCGTCSSRVRLSMQLHIARPHTLALDRASRLADLMVVPQRPPSAQRFLHAYEYGDSRPGVAVDPTGKLPWYVCLVVCVPTGIYYFQCYELCSTVDSLNELDKRWEENNAALKICDETGKTTAECVKYCIGIGSLGEGKCIQCCDRIYPASNQYSQLCRCYEACRDSALRKDRARRRANKGG